MPRHPRRYYAVSCAETAEPTNRSRCRLGYGLGRAQGSMYQMGSRSPMRRGQFSGKHVWACPVTLCRELCKTFELIEKPFGLWTPVGRRKHVLDVDAQWRHLANTIETFMFGWAE